MTLTTLVNLTLPEALHLETRVRASACDLWGHNPICTAGSSFFYMFINLILICRIGRIAA